MSRICVESQYHLSHINKSFSQQAILPDLPDPTDLEVNFFLQTCRHSTKGQLP